MVQKKLYEALLEEFLKIVQERYPTSDKIIKAAVRLGFREPPEQIIVISVWRDSVRQVSPRLYRNVEHRQEISAAIIEALEDLEDLMEELEEEEELGNEEEEGVT